MAAFQQQQSRPVQHLHPCRHHPLRCRRPLDQRLHLRLHRLGQHANPAFLLYPPLLRHRPARTRPPHPSRRRRTHFPAHRHCRRTRCRRHRHALRRARRLFRRQTRLRHDAPARNPQRLSVYVFRHPVDHLLRTQPLTHLRRHRTRLMAGRRPHRPRTNPQPQTQRIRRSRPHHRRIPPPHRYPPHHPQRTRRRHGLRLPARPRHDHVRILPQLPRIGRTRTPDQLGFHAPRGRSLHGSRPVAAPRPLLLPRRHPLLLQLYRRRPARRTRPQRPLAHTTRTHP